LLIGCPGPRSSAVSDAVDFWLHACHLRRVGMLGSAVLRSPPWPSSQSWPLPSGKNGSTSCSAYGSQRLRGLSGSLVTQPPPGSTCSLASLSRSCPPPGCGSCTAARRASRLNAVRPWAVAPRPAGPILGYRIDERSARRFVCPQVGQCHVPNKPDEIFDRVDVFGPSRSI
jgi:hypothetical protein